MHPKLDELLALRNGDGSANTARHVARCETCRSEIDELCAALDALRSLPSCPPPRDAWADIRNRVVSRRRKSIGLRFAAAVACLLAVLTVVLFTRFRSMGAADPGNGGAGDARVAVKHLSKASRELELVLQDPSLQSRVLSTRRAAMIVELEDRIALVDLALAQDFDGISSQRAVALWSDRVELLDALVTARGGDVSSHGVTLVNHRRQGGQK